MSERLDLFHLSLQKRNSSTAYSSSLRDLLQRKISTLEGQLHHHNNPEHHDDDATHRDDGDHPADNHHNDDHKGDAGHEENHTDHHDDDDNQDLDGDHDSHHHDDEEDADHHDNEADSHSYLPHTGYSVPGPRTGPHSNKLETILNQLQLTGKEL